LTLLVAMVTRSSGLAGPRLEATLHIRFHSSMRVPERLPEGRCEARTAAESNAASGATEGGCRERMSLQLS